MGKMDTHSGPPQAKALAAYTCIMHPQIRHAGPGHCPICGMALEPVLESAQALPNLEYVAMTQRLWGSLVLATPVFILGMGGWISPHMSLWIEAVLTTGVVAWGGFPLFQRGWQSLRNRSLDMFTLVSLGIGTTYLYSCVATLLPDTFPRAFRTQAGLIPVYFEAAAMITVLVLLGQVLELRARAQTGGAIRALLKLVPPIAHRVRNGGPDEDIALDQIKRGDTLRIKPGETVPVDGVVLAGTSAVDEAMVTGEALPVVKQPRSTVIGGTINGTGSLAMRADRVGENTTLAQIVRMVSQAQRSRAPIQRLADRVSGVFVPAILVCAAMAFVAWLIFGPPPAFGFALNAAVSVLMIACPCALGLATPLSIMVGIGKGATAGVLIKNAEVLERFEKVDTLVVDKTGTLTEGRPRVLAVVAMKDFDEATVLGFAASLERSSEHPLAAAVVACAKSRGLGLSAVANFRSVTGKGVTGQIGMASVAVGNAVLLGDSKIAVAALDGKADVLRETGATVMYVAITGELAGLIAIADPIKTTAKLALDSLKAAGLRIVMVTGDNRKTADAVAAKLGITAVEAGVLPEHKRAIVQRLRAEGRIVAMAGDGINDAPALAAADVGIAMGTGTDVAIQSAGVTLVMGDLSGIVRARLLSRATMTNIRENLVLACVYNALGVPIAAGVFYPWFGLLLSPVMAAAAMSLSSVSVIGNALRLRWAKL